MQSWALPPISNPTDGGMHVETIQLNSALRRAIVWSIASDLFRYHGRSMDLRLSITRPNQYVCLNVHSLRRNRRIFWNLIGTSAKIVEEDGKWAEFLPAYTQGHYLDVALVKGTRAVLRHVEEALLCDPRTSEPEKTGPPALCFRATATLMRQRAFWDGPELDADCGLSDGNDGTWVQDFLASFAPLHAAASAALACDDIAEARRFANRVWRFGRVSFDVVTGDAVDPDGRRTSLWSLYEQGNQSIWPVVAWLDEHV
jgi:hypothetical protein